jgi:hypothetical protein
MLLHRLDADLPARHSRAWPSVGALAACMCGGKWLGTVLQCHGQRLRVIYSNYLVNDAHIVGVDPATGRSYFPVLGASGGHPAVLVCEIT